MFGNGCNDSRRIRRRQAAPLAQRWSRMRTAKPAFDPLDESLTSQQPAVPGINKRIGGRLGQSRFDLPPIGSHALAWSSAQVSQQAAADALFGGIPISGRSPTGMDPFFAVGDGIQVPLKVGVGGR